MARSFGALVQRVLYNTGRDNAAGFFPDQVRLHLVDALEHYRSEDFSRNRETVTFTATAGASSFAIDGSGVIAKRFRDIKHVWWTDASGARYPASEDGVEQVSYPELYQYLSEVSSLTADHIDMWAVEGQTLYVAPPTSGITIAVNGVTEPSEYTYRYSGNAWTFYKNGTQVADIDAEASDARFDYMGDLLVAEATRALFVASAGGEEKTISRWQSEVDRALMRLSVEKERLTGTTDAQRYIGP